MKRYVLRGKGMKKQIKKAEQKASLSIANCQFTSEPFVFNAEMGRAVEALAKAAQANAEAIKSVADRIAGPINNGHMINVEGSRE